MPVRESSWAAVRQAYPRTAALAAGFPFSLRASRTMRLSEGPLSPMMATFTSLHHTQPQAPAHPSSPCRTPGVPSSALTVSPGFTAISITGTSRKSPMSAPSLRSAGSWRQGFQTSCCRVITGPLEAVSNSIPALTPMRAMASASAAESKAAHGAKGEIAPGADAPETVEFRTPRAARKRRRCLPSLAIRG